MNDDLPSSDPAHMKLSHPERCKIMMADSIDAIQSVVGEREWKAWQEGLKDVSRSVTDVIGELSNPRKYPRSSEYLVMMSLDASSTDQGGAMGLLAWMRHHYAATPHVLIDDSLVELLNFTDLTPEIPLAFLTPPFPSFYMEFGKLRNNPIVVPNAESGDHVLEGAYIEIGSHEVDGEVLNVVLIGSPIGKAHIADDATLSVTMPLDSVDMPLVDAIHRSFSEVQSDNDASALAANWIKSPKYFQDRSVDALLMVAKAMLYMSLSESRQELYAMHSEALEALVRLKSPAKKAKAERKAARLIDYILVRAHPDHKMDGGEYGTAAGRSVKTHWRRGHLRTQRHGSLRALSKIILIKPVLVAAAPGEEPPPPSNYKVT